MDQSREILIAKFTFLLAFFVLGVAHGPFLGSASAAALLTGFAGIAGMAIHNAVQRVYFAHIPPTTIMTGNTTQAVLDAVNLARGEPVPDAAAVRARFPSWHSVVRRRLHRRRPPVLLVRLWCLAVPVAVDAATAILRDDSEPSQAAAPQAVVKGP